MGRYRARDLFLVPGLLSLARLPLALSFYLFIDTPAVAIGVLAVAGGTDVFDGWYARRHGMATPTGAVLDGVTDKIFVFSVVATLLVEQRLALIDLLLLSTREVGELPLLVWWALSHRQRLRKSTEPRANVPGKLSTVFQFGTVAAATAGEVPPALVWTTAALGAVAAISYWVRELSAARRA